MTQPHITINGIPQPERLTVNGESYMRIATFNDLLHTLEGLTRMAEAVLRSLKHGEPTDMRDTRVEALKMAVRRSRELLID